MLFFFVEDFVLPLTGVRLRRSLFKPTIDEIRFLTLRRLSDSPLNL